MQLRHPSTRASLLSVCLCITAASVGCGSEEDDDGASGTSSGDGDGDSDPELGGPEIAIDDMTTPGTGGAVGTVVFDGGTVVLTEEQLAELSEDSCAGWKHEGEVLPSTIQLVIDVSSSMDDLAPGTNLSKWEVTRDLLLEAIVGVEGPGLPPGVAVGALFYPNRDGVESTVEPQDINACVKTDALVGAQPLGAADGEHRALVRSSIAQAETEQWTPTHDALRFALNEGLLPSTLPGHKFLLLITDGAPTFSLGCTQPEGGVDGGGVDPEPIVDEIALAAAAGVRTFLIGSPGSEPNREWMSRAAVIGGTAAPGCNVVGPVGQYCHMDMTESDDFSQALRKGLSAVAGVLTPCTYTFPEAPEGQTLNRDQVNVIMKKANGESTLVVRDDEGECDEGWIFGSDNEVVLCKSTCSDVQIEPTTTVELVFGCDSFTVIEEE